MLGGHQPNNSSALAWTDKQAALSDTQLAANPNGMLTTGADGTLAVLTTIPDALLPASIELTGDMTAANLVSQTAAIQNGVTAGSITTSTLNGATVPTANLTPSLCTQRATGMAVSGLNQVDFTIPDTAVPIAGVVYLSSGTEFQGVQTSINTWVGYDAGTTRTASLYFSSTNAWAYEAFICYVHPAVGLSG